jgi:sirohydrochlorin ferrochelatase
MSLRRVAKPLAERLDCEVRAVSLLHSSKVPADTLGGDPAQLLESSLVGFFAQNPGGRAILLPLFFGPSAALTDYVPARIKAVRERFPGAQIDMAPWLVDIGSPDRRMAGILADRVRELIRSDAWSRPQVILVDHGSPQPAVAAVRNHLGAQVRDELGDEVAGLTVASMERRDGDAYAFNDPLLATALATAPSNQGNVVIALQFLSPGRHAGAGGDIAEICDAAEQAQSGLTTRMTETIATDVRLVDLLVERFAEARPV